MKEVDYRATKLLLSNLDNEIDRKCMEIKEKQQQMKLKRVFFSSCIVVLLLFIMQLFFNIFNVNLLIVFFAFQGAALLIVLPVVFNLTKSRIG